MNFCLFLCNFSADSKELFLHVLGTWDIKNNLKRTKMSSIQSITDKFAIGLSSICAMHCLLFPIALGLLPSLAALPLGGESFHFWMVLAVIPTSAIALFLGCKKHGRTQVLLWGVPGVLLLVLAILLGEDLIGEVGEKGLTLLGATLVSIGHFLNYRLCRSHDHCHCPSEDKDS